MMINKHEYQTGLLVHGIPEHCHEGLLDYFLEHIPTGDFLHAVLSNDLTQAVCRADGDNLTALPNYVRFLCEYAPSDSWGSKVKVDKWLKK